MARPFKLPRKKLHLHTTHDSPTARNLRQTFPFDCVSRRDVFFFISEPILSQMFTFFLCFLDLDDIIMKFLFFLLPEIINTTKNIQWSKVAANIQVMVNQTMIRTGTFVSETVWASDFFKATVISVLFLTAYWSIIYLDSSQPGINPPSPLATITRKK